jgi:hypothetical protein
MAETVKVWFTASLRDGDQRQLDLQAALPHHQLRARAPPAIGDRPALAARDYPRHRGGARRLGRRGKLLKRTVSEWCREELNAAAKRVRDSEATTSSKRQR